MLVLGVFLCLLLAQTGSFLLGFLFPIAIITLVIASVLFFHPQLSIAFAILGFILMASNETGFQATEIIYAFYLFVVFLTWFLRNTVFDSQVILTQRADWSLSLFLGLLPLTLLLTYFFRGDFLIAMSELISLSMLLIYFPIKHIVAHDRHGPKLILISVVIMCSAVAISNSLEYASDLSNAIALSQVAGSRVVVNDALLMCGTIMSLTLLVFARNPLSFLFSLGALTITFAGLIMTQARGAWLAFLLGVIALIVLVQTSERIRILTIGAILGALIIGVGYILIGPFLNVILVGIIERFGSIMTAVTQDLSLVNRFRETSTVLEKIMVNPLIGYGPGVSYLFFDIVHQYTDTDSFVHNGYIGLWYKYGVWGLGLILVFWYSTIKQGLIAFRSERADRWTRSVAIAGAIPLIALTVTTLISNPFFLKNQIFIVAVAAGMAAGAGQRISKYATVNHP